MPFLPGLAVIFVGIAGGDGKMDKQVQQLLHVEHVDKRAIAVDQVHTLAHHGEGAGDVVRALHVDGVIAGELVGSGHDRTLRVAIYNADGSMRSLSELPMDGPALTASEIGSLRENLQGEVHALVASAGKGAHAGADDSDASDDDSVAVVAPPPPKPVPVKKVAPPPTKKVAPPAAIVETTPEIDDAPPATDTKANAPAADAADSDSVNVADLEAMARGDGDDAAATTVTTTAPSIDAAALHLCASAGLGVAARSFTPGPSTVPGYASSAVGTVRLDARVQPTQHTMLSVMGERALDMSTPMSTGTAPTTMSRWEVVGGYTFGHAVEFAPEVGFGRRGFSIDSTDPSRSPDGDYQYLIAGAQLKAGLGHGIAIVGNAAFEPVIGGTQSTAMSFGDAAQWALDVGAAIEIRPIAHVIVRATADYQRFAWAWDAAGTRAAGSAVDSYPTGMLSVGALY